MTILPTWDLFFIIFIAVIMTYSFMIGRENTVKLALATYMSIFCADALGNILDVYFFGIKPIFTKLEIGSFTYPFAFGGFENDYDIWAKLFFFSLFLIIMKWKGNFVADMNHFDIPPLSWMITVVMGFLTSAVVICGVFVFINDGSFISGTTFEMNVVMRSIYDHSFFAKAMVDHINFWFVFPVVAFLIGSVSSE